MENRIRIFLLSLAVLASGCSSRPWRRDDAQAEPPPPPESAGTPVVIDPQVERREVETAKIDTENWEAGAYVGSLSVECSQAASEQLGCFDGSQKHVVASCGGIRHESPSGVRLRGGLQWIFERKRHSDVVAE